MSGGGEKTEKPTPRRLADARKRGQVAKSNDFNAALVLIAVALLLTMYGSYLYQYMTRITLELLTHQLRSTEPMTLQMFQTIFVNLVYHVILAVAPFVGGILVIGVAANLFQVKFLFTTHPLKPSLEKINPLEGFKRLFSQKSVVELVKGILKMAIVGACGYGVIHANESHLLSASQMSFVQGWILIFQVALNICATIAAVLLVLGIADWWYQKYQLTKQLRMTRQEIKDEHKNTEGNPEVKRKVKATGQAMVRKRMLQAVPQADVIVTNPTHFAVAIQYDPDVAPAPRVIAKGVDELAFRIREVGKENGVLIVENKPLARTLYAMVEVDHMIPPDLFVAVAEVLAYVFKRNKGRGKPHIRRMFSGGPAR